MVNITNKINVCFLPKLRDALARGDLKPGLNVEVTEGTKRPAVNNTVSITFFHTISWRRFNIAQYNSIHRFDCNREQKKYH